MASTHDNQPVDMVEIARQTTKRDIERQYPDTIKVITPAKVNLCLAVGGRRDDGYHEVDNVMHAVMMHDVMYLRMRSADDERSIVSVEGDACEAAPEFEVVVQCVGTPGCEAPSIATRDNLAFRAVRALAQLSGVDFAGNAQVLEIRIEKSIPAQAGMAGGSSNAAGALLGAAKLFGLDRDDERIGQVAQEIGSDVAFFLKGGCARYEGRGERFAQSLNPRKGSIALIKPAEGLSTAEVYRRYDDILAVDAGVAAPVSAPDAPAPDPDPAPAPDAPAPDPAAAPDAPDPAPAPGAPDAAIMAECREVVAAARTATTAQDVPLFNSLERPAFEMLPLLAQVHDWAAAQPGVRAVMMCGSGSATFVVCDSQGDASNVAAGAKLQGWWARTTSFAPMGAAVMPKRS